MFVGGVFLVKDFIKKLLIYFKKNLLLERKKKSNDLYV